MFESTVTDRGRTTVPREVRKALGIKPRQRLQWDLSRDGKVTVQPQPSALALYGSLRTREKLSSIRDEKATVRRQAANRAARNV